MKKKVVYIVESFATGILFYLVNMTNSLSNKYDFLILHGMREETPKDFKKFFSKNVKFVEIKNLKRKVSFQDFKAVKEGNVWCTGENLYQQTTDLGKMILEFSTILSGAQSQDEMTYMKKLD